MRRPCALDIEQALLVELRDGYWADVRAQPLDQQAFDAFWSAVSEDLRQRV
jgi:hypothetical protein